MAFDYAPDPDGTIVRNVVSEEIGADGQIYIRTRVYNTDGSIKRDEGLLGPVAPQDGVYRRAQRGVGTVQGARASSQQAPIRKDLWVLLGAVGLIFFLRR